MRPHEQKQPQVPKSEFCPVLEHVDVNVDVKTLYLPQELVDHI